MIEERTLSSILNSSGNVNRAMNMERNDRNKSSKNSRPASTPTRLSKTVTTACAIGGCVHVSRITPVVGAEIRDHRFPSGAILIAHLLSAVSVNT